MSLWKDITSALSGGAKTVGNVGSLTMGALTGNQQEENNARAALNNSVHQTVQGAVAAPVQAARDVGGIAEGIAKPAVYVPMDILQAAGNLGTMAAGGTPQSSQQFWNTPGTEEAQQWSGATGKLKQAASGLAQEAINTAAAVAAPETGGVSETIAAALPKAVPAVASKVATGAGFGGVVGAASNLANYLGGDQPITAGGAAKAAGQGALTGAAMGGAVPAAAGAVEGAGALSEAAQRYMADHPLNEVGGVRLGMPEEVPVNESGKVPAPAGSLLDDLRAINEGRPPQAAPAEASTAPVTPETTEAELDQHIMNPGLDWTKVEGAGKEFEQTRKQVAAMLKNIDDTQTGDQMQPDGQGGYVRTSAHSPFYRQIFQETGRKPTQADWLKAADDYMQKATGDEGRAYHELGRHVRAEQLLKDYEAANKASGYNKAKWMLPKGAPKRGFDQKLFEKTNSSEYKAMAESRGNWLDNQTNLKEATANLRDAEKRFNQSLKKNASADERKAAADEYRRQTVRMRILQEKNRSLAADFGAKKTILDTKYPDYMLSNVKQRGVRLSTAQPYETAKPVAETTTPSPAVTAAATEKPYSLEEVLGTKNTQEPYNGPNLNENLFPKEDIAKWAKEQQENEETMPRIDQDAQRNMLDNIGANKSADEVIKAYAQDAGVNEERAKNVYEDTVGMQNTEDRGNPQNNPYYGKVADYDVSDVGEGKMFVNRNKTLMQKSLLKATAPGNLLDWKANDATYLWSKLSPEARQAADQLRGHSIEDVAATLPEDQRALFTEYAQRVRDSEDYLMESRRVAEPLDVTPYRLQYGAGKYVKTEDGSVVPFEDYLGRTPSWAKGRTDESYNNLPEGMERANNSFHEDFLMDMQRSRNYIAQHGLYNNLRAQFGDDGVNYGKPKGSATVQLKQFKNVFVTPELAKFINSRSYYQYGEGAIGNLLKVTDAVNQGAKSLKLSFGGFHNINEALNLAALDPKDLGAAARVLADPDYFRARMNQFEANGTMEKAVHSGLTLGSASENVLEGPASVGGRFRAIVEDNPLSKALFQRQIPFSKLATFDTYTKDLDLHNADDYAHMRGAARGLNNTYGGINRLVDGMNPTALRRWSRTILATDYNEGQIRTLMTALGKGGLEGRLARQVVVGRASILAMPGITQGIVTGQIGSNPKDISKFVAQQLVNPTVNTPWKTAGGIPKNAKLVPGVVNKLYRGVMPMFDKNNPDKLSGLQQELSGNLSPLLSTAQEEVTNKDFYGNPMHGKGLNAAEDIGQFVNANAPVPTQPVGRVLAGTPLGNNAAVKIMSGGQSPISAAEAAVDVSGVGRVSANQNAPQMQIMNNRSELYQGLSKDNQAALDQVHPSWGGMDKAAQNAVYADKNYEINKWNVLRSNPAVYDALKNQNDFAAAHGEPSNPLFNLNQRDYQVLTEYEFLKHADIGTDANNSAAVLYAQNKQMISDYEAANSQYQKQMNTLYAQSTGAKGDNAPVMTVGGAPKYTLTNEQQSDMQAYYAMTDSKQRAEYLTNHPDVSQAFEMIFNAQNAVRAQQHEPLLKDYPQAPAGLQDWMNQYIAGSKTQRKALRTGDPNAFSQMQNYMAQVDEYNVSKTAGQAQFQGQNLSQTALKAIYNLGKYDIAKPSSLSGEYSIDPAMAYSQGSSRGGGSGAYSTSQIQQADYLSRKGKANLAGENYHLSQEPLFSHLNKSFKIPIRAPWVNTRNDQAIHPKAYVKGPDGRSIKIRSQRAKVYVTRAKVKTAA